MSNYPDGINVTAMENAIWGPELTKHDEDRLDTARDDLNRAIGNMQQAVSYAMDAIKNAEFDSNEMRMDVVREIYGLLHDSIIDGHHDEINIIEEIEGIEVKLPDLRQMLNGVDRI